MENEKNLIETPVQKCPNCEKEINKDDAFCKHCGAKTESLTSDSAIENNAIIEETDAKNVVTEETTQEETIVENTKPEPIPTIDNINNPIVIKESIPSQTEKIDPSNIYPYTTENAHNNPNKLKKQVKSIGIGISAIVAIAVITLILSALICDHEYNEPTCTTPATCSLCDKTKGDPLGHSWLDATCTSLKTCSTCGETEGDMLEHTPGEWKSNTDYVKAKNISEQKCTVCDTIIDSKSTNITKLHKNKLFLLSPVEFIDRLNNSLDSLSDNELSAFGGSTDDSYGCLIYNGTSKVGTFIFSNDSTVISPDEKDNQCFSVLLGSVDDNDNVARVLVSLIETCDPTLDLEETKEIAEKAIDNGSCTKNGITYVFVDDTGDSAYLGASLLK